MMHAGTKEREILDELLTDPSLKRWDRRRLEDLIERIAGDLVLENDELKSEVDVLRDENSALSLEITNLEDQVSNQAAALYHLKGQFDRIAEIVRNVAD